MTMEPKDFDGIRRRGASEIVGAVPRMPTATLRKRLALAVALALREEWWRGYWSAKGEPPGGDDKPPSYRVHPAPAAAPLAYSLDPARAIASRYATPDEIALARMALIRATKHAKLMTMSACWVCSPPSGRHLLENLDDGFAFRCARCGTAYCQGVVVEEQEPV